MKKILSLVLILGIPALMMAQVFTDNFDSYTAGNYLGDESIGTHWTTWNDMPGTGEDGVISNKYAASAPNSLEVKENNDVIYSFSNIYSGHYTLSFNYLIPEGSSGGYFNCMHEFNGSSSVYAFDCYFSNNGTGYLTEKNIKTNFSFPQHDWFPIVIDIDFDRDTITLSVDGKFVAGWLFHYTMNGSGLYDKLSVINYYGTSANGNSGTLYYIDDFSFVENPVGVNDYKSPQVTIFPNPTSSQINITADQINQVELYNLVGQCIYKVSCTENTISIPATNLTAGTYIVKVLSDDGISTQKVIVK